jgi:ankyrin repeat protein
MRIYLQLNALKTPDSYPDIFAVSGMKTKDLLKIVPSREIVGNFYFSVSVYKQKEIYNACESSRFIVLCSRDLETCFLKLCEKHSEKRLHWVEYNNGDLLWKMSRGGTDSLLHYVDAEKTRADKRIVAEYMKSVSCEVNEESIWDLGEGPVLVVAEPGMGKSTSATHLAWNKKLADPTSWVLRINWNENCRQLEEINPKTCNIDNIVQFFGSAVFPVSKYYNLSKTLLKQALEVSGNITVLTNGYEQISPIDADKADVILSTLRKTRVSRICVMSCPVTRERLEKRLAVEALTLEPLSNSSQELILLNLWTSKANTNTDQTSLIDFIKRLLSLTHKSVYDRSFTSSPFFIMMIATAFELNVETGDFSLPESLDLVYLYGRFFERGLHNYQLQKKKEGVQSNHEMLTSKFLKNVERCALIDTLPSPVLKALHDKEIGEEIKPFVSEVLAGKHKTGLAISGLEGRPHFMHPQFAQCLTARWFSKNFESNRSVLEKILFEPPYDVVKAEFDRILASGSELHSAVLNLNIKGVENLLQAESDISARDRGGRTAMHLIAAQGERACWAEDITDSLLNHGACLCDEDNVMQWTPLRYAIKSGAWFVVEQLLKHNVDRKDLEVIINRVHDSDYIGEIVVEAVQQDCLLLVQFLKSIGVDIDQRFTVMKVTAMHVAAENRQLRIMRWLIEQGADCDTSCGLDQTPLIKAARDGCIDTVRMLVEEGDASLNVRDIVGRTALDWAIIQAAGGADSQYVYDKESDGRIGAEAVVKYLRERGCKESDIPDGIVLEMITGFTSLSMDPTQ